MRFTARVRDNAFEFRDLPSGDYLLQLRLPGRESVMKTVYVGSDEGGVVDLEAGGLREKK